MNDNHGDQNPDNQLDPTKNAQQQDQNLNQNETTYWESNLADQASEHTTLGASEHSTQSTSERSTQGTSEYAPLNSSHQSVYYSNDFSQPPKKSLRGVIIATVAVLIILLAGAGTAYAFKDTLANSLAKATKNPVEYYTFIEKNNINQGVEKLSPYLNFNTLESELAYDISSDVTINKVALNSLLQTSLGVSISDFEAELGIPLDHIGFDAFIGTNGEYTNETFTLSLNQVELITTELFFDTAAQEILVRFPELSSAYLNITGDSMPNTDLSYRELMTKERTSDLLKRYSHLIIDHINQVEMKDTDELRIGSLSTDCTELIITITEQDLYNMVLDILMEAKEDQYIIDLLPMFQLTKEDYQTYVDSTLANMQTYSSTVTDESIQMLVYIDNQGNIIGRKIKSNSSNVSYGYTYLTDRDQNEYNVYASDELGANIFQINGSQTKDNEAYDGKATLVINGTGDYSSMFSLDLTYEDMRTEIKDNISYQYGSLTLSSLELMGLQIRIDFDVQDNIQNSKVIFQMGAEPLVTIDTQRKHRKDYEVVLPPANAETYDISKAESYAATMDLEGYLANLSEKLGIDLQSIFDNYMNGNIY